MKRFLLSAVALFLFALPSSAAFSNANLNGSYVFSYSAFDYQAAWVAIVVAGSFQADGNGAITAGLMDQNGPGSTLATQIAFTGAYSIDASGRGRLQILTSSGTKTFSLVMASNDRAKIITFDPTPTGTADVYTGTGEIEKRTLTTFDNSSLAKDSSWVFLLEGGGVHSMSTDWAVAAGRFTSDGAGSLSAGVEDVNDTGALWQNITFGGSYSVAANGRGTATWTTAISPMQLSFYPVSPYKVKFISLDAGGGFVGDADLQDTGAFSNSFISGDYAFLERGLDAWYNWAWYGEAGRFTADGSGGINSGILSANEPVFGPAALNVPFTGNYAVAPTGRALVTFQAGANTFNYAEYVVSKDKLKYILLNSASGTISDTWLVSGGVAERQVGPPFSNGSLLGKFAFSSFGFLSSQNSWYETAKDGNVTGDANGSVSGSEDYNFVSVLATARPLTASFSMAANGVGSLIVAYSGAPNDHYAVYGVSPVKAFYLYTDTDGALTGTMDRLGPYVAPTGSVNAASFAGGGLAPGALFSLFGQNLAPAGADGLFLTTANGITVTLNGVAAPLSYISPGQINIQVPWELAGQTQATLVVSDPDFTSPPQTVAVSPTSPGIFSFGPPAFYGAVRNALTSVFALPAGAIPGVTSTPVTRGVDWISIYCTGLGAVDQAQATGAKVPLTSQVRTTNDVMVEFGPGGKQVAANFAGLAPTYIGLYQVNVQIPADAPTGTVQIRLLVRGQASNSAAIAIQ